MLVIMITIHIRIGLYMLAISFNWTEYACNVGNRPRVTLTMISGRISRKQIFDDCKHIWSLLKEIASIYSPLSIELQGILGSHCYGKHIWSLSSKILS